MITGTWTKADGKWAVRAFQKGAKFGDLCEVRKSDGSSKFVTLGDEIANEGAGIFAIMEEKKSGGFTAKQVESHNSYMDSWTKKTNDRFAKAAARA